MHLSLPYDVANDKYVGLPFNIGSTENVAVHMNSSKADVHRLANSILHNVNQPFSEIVCNETTMLPKWNDATNLGKTVKKCFELLHKNEFDDQTFLEVAKKTYGCIDDKHPLVIVSIYRPNYNHRTSECVIRHRDALMRHCNAEFTYVCLSNQEIEGIDTIPYDEKVNDIEKLLFNKKIVYPKNAIVMYSSVDDVIKKDFNLYYNVDRRYLTINDIQFVG